MSSEYNPWSILQQLRETKAGANTPDDQARGVTDMDKPVGPATLHSLADLQVELASLRSQVVQQQVEIAGLRKDREQLYRLLHARQHENKESYVARLEESVRQLQDQVGDLKRSALKDPAPQPIPRGVHAPSAAAPVTQHKLNVVPRTRNHSNLTISSTAAMRYPIDLESMTSSMDSLARDKYRYMRSDSPDSSSEMPLSTASRSVRGHASHAPSEAYSHPDHQSMGSSHVESAYADPSPTSTRTPQIVSRRPPSQSFHSAPPKFGSRTTGVPGYPGSKVHDLDTDSHVSSVSTRDHHRPGSSGDGRIHIPAAVKRVSSGAPIYQKPHISVEL